jgi:DNA-binding transcriptional LysR family regulator
METQYLKTLLTVAQEGSFSRAAIKLNVTQSAVSQRTKNLESCCGVTLLDRSGATLQPTIAGRVVLDNAERILQLEENMLRDVRALTGKKYLHICCTPAFGLAHLPQIIRDFTHHNQDVNDLMFLFAAPAQALDGLRAGEFDVAVIEHLPDIAFGEMRHLDLPEDEMVFVSAPSLGIQAGEVTLDELQAHCFILRREGCSCRDLLAVNLTMLRSDIDLFQRIMVFDDFNLILAQVLAATGITFISRAAVADYVASGKLREHTVAEFQRFRQRSIVALSCESPTSLKRIFMGCVLDHFNQKDLSSFSF